MDASKTLRILALACFVGAMAVVYAMPAQPGSVLNPKVEKEKPAIGKNYHYQIDGLVPYNTRKYYTDDFYLEQGAIWFYDKNNGDGLVVLSMPFEARLVRK